MTEALILNERQLELLLDPKILSILGVFKTAKSPSEGAKELKLSASKLHYHVKKLAEAGLLVAKGKRGKSTLFEAVAKTYYIPEKQVPGMTLGMPQLLEGMFDAFKRGLEKSFEGKLRATLENSDFEQCKCFFTLDQIDEVNFEDAYPGQLRFHTSFLTSEQYKKLMTTMLNTLNEFAKQSNENADTKACSVSFVCFQGETSLSNP